MAGPAAPGARRAGGEEAGAGGDAGAAGRRAWAVDQLCGVCKSASTQHAVQLAVLRFLTAQAFFDVRPPPASPSPPLLPTPILRHLRACRRWQWRAIRRKGTAADRRMFVLLFRVYR